MFSNWIHRIGNKKTRTPNRNRRACLRLAPLEHRITPALNDNFADADVLIGQFDARLGGNYEFDPMTFDIIPFTGEVGEPNHAGVSAPLESAWYRWTAPANVSATIALFIFNGFPSLAAAVYTGTTVNALTEVTSGTDPFGPTLRFNAVAGTTYSIAVDSEGAGPVDFQLILSAVDPPANNDFADAIVLDGSPVPVAIGAGSSTGSSFEPGEPNHAEGLEYFGFPLTLTDSTWFEWTAPTTGAVQIKLESDIDFGNTFFAGVTAGLAVYTGPAVNQLNLTANSFGFSSQFLAVNDDFLFSGAGLSFNSVAGTTYHIAVAGNSLFPENHSLKLINYAIPGSIAIDGTVYVVGTTGSDTVSITPAGAVSNGSTGVQVKSNAAGSTTTKTILGPANALEIFVAGGNNVVTVSDSITLNTEAEFGSGNDKYEGGSGPTTIYAGEGNNVVHAGAKSTNFVDVYAGSGNDDIRTGGGIDFIRAGDGNNTVLTGAGDDSVFLLPVWWADSPFTGNNFIDLGSGNDYVDVYSDGPTQVLGGPGNDNVSVSGKGNAHVIGGDGNDQINAGDGNNLLFGGAGNDFIFAGTGNNLIDAGSGDDNIFAGSYFQPGSGFNLILGGSGNDTVAVNSNGLCTVIAGDGDDEVVLGFKLFPGAPIGTGAGIVFGGNGNDILIGGSANDTLSGDAGHDLVAGGLGRDILIGGAGNDLLFDGQVVAANPADSLRQILNDWNPSSLASYVDVRARITVTFDTSSRDLLFGNSGTDWFWSDDPLDLMDRLPSESRN